MVNARDISLTFMKGMSVLKVFDETRAQMNLAEIARKTGLDAATARRLVLTLVELGYVKKDGRQFSLTPRVLVLAAGFLRGHQFGTLVQPALNRTAAETGLGVSLAMQDEGHALLVAQSTLTGSTVTFGFTVGSRLPLLQTAIGRMLLAGGAAPETRALVAQTPVEAFTPESETDRARILAEVETARAQGYCLARSQFEAGVTGIAVPVGQHGAGPAVLGVSEATARFSEPGIVTDLVNALRRCAQELARMQAFGGV